MMYDATIVVPCKGRLHYLKQSVLSLLLQQTNFSYRVLVVDYGCPQGTMDWIKSQKYPRLHCIKVRDNTETFNLPRARNIGMRHAAARMVTRTDCDILFPTTYVETALASMARHSVDLFHYAVNSQTAKHTTRGRFTYDHYCATAKEKIAWTPVSSFVRREIWESVRGFDEILQGWGNDDTDFHHRLQRVIQRELWAGCQTEWLHTTAEERVEFYEEKDHLASAARNAAVIADATRDVNPDGFGEANDFELWEG